MDFNELSTTVKLIFSPKFVMIILANDMPNKYLGRWVCSDYDWLRFNLWSPMSINDARKFIERNNLKLVGSVK